MSRLGRCSNSRGAPLVRGPSAELRKWNSKLGIRGKKGFCRIFPFFGPSEGIGGSQRRRTPSLQLGSGARLGPQLRQLIRGLRWPSRRRVNIGIMSYFPPLGHLNQAVKTCQQLSIDVEIPKVKKVRSVVKKWIRTLLSDPVLPLSLASAQDAT